MKTIFTTFGMMAFFSIVHLSGQVSFISNGQSITSSDSWDIRLVDIDGDGDLDAYFEKKVWLNDGNGIFTKTNTTFGSSDYARFADINEDGYVDAVSNDSIYLNDSAYHFNFSRKLVSDIEMISSVLADIDNDGDIDIISCSETSDRILLNDGKGNFTNTGKSLGGWGQANYAIGDINGDGFTDIYVAIPHNPPPPPFLHATNKIWFGDGNGNFTVRNHDISGAESRGVILSDFNGDGHPDLFISDRKTWGRLYLNDGAGNFNDSGQKLGSHPVLSASADFDNDGDTDLFICQNDGNLDGPPFTISVPSIVMINDGTGHFTDSGLKLGTSTSMAVAVGDLNNDNKTDAFVVNVKLNGTTYAAETCPVEIWLNNSTPTSTKQINDDKNVVTIFPNPCDRQLNIRYNNPLNKPASLTISDIQGRKVFMNTNFATENSTLDLTGFSKGVYIINLKWINNSINKIIFLD